MCAAISSDCLLRPNLAPSELSSLNESDMSAFLLEAMTSSRELQLDISGRLPVSEKAITNEVKEITLEDCQGFLAVMGIYSVFLEMKASHPVYAVFVPAVSI